MQWYYGFDFGADIVRRVDIDGTITQEAAWAAVRAGEEAPFAWGDRAYTFLGRESNGIQLKQCMRAGLPVDFELMRRWLMRLVSASEKSVLRRRRLLVCVSNEISMGTQSHLLKSLLEGNMDMVGAVSADMACALGADLDVMGEKGCFVLDIGASHMTFSVIAGGRRIRARNLPYGMDRADESIIDRVRESEGVIISRRVARLLKHSAFSGAGKDAMLGVFDPLERLPKYMKLDPELARSSLNEIVSGVLELCKSAIIGLSPELNDDLEANGIVIAGGGSQMSGLDVCLSEEMKLPVKTASEPCECAIRGLGMILKQPELYSPLVSDWREGSLRL